MSYQGGYRFLAQPIVRTGIYAHTMELPDPISDLTLSALNIVQSTPWRINERILDTMMEAYRSGLSVGELPYHDNKELPSKTDAEWEAMSEAERTAWKRKLSTIHGENARLEGRRRSFAQKINISRTLREEPEIYFPHFLDFRMRVYPMPADLTPQADDLGKSLLEFAYGKALGEHGLYWLSVRAANDYGQDKLDLDERVQWVMDHMREISDSARSPLDGWRFWEQADDPWQFLATCFELDDALSMEDPSEYVSHLPVNMDGSCNGLQHLSALGRDRVGAIATNVANNTERQDIYQQVADVVMEIVSRDAANGNDQAHEWVGRVDRKVVKRAVSENG